jgi:dihydrofolate synthase/folylpolyglutamate synthase
VAKRIVLSQQANPRAAAIETLKRLTTSASEPTQIHTAASPGEAINIARQITPADELICITGSLYLIGDIQRELVHSRHQTQAN